MLYLRIRQIRLSVFARVILKLCKEWFGIEVSFEPIQIQLGSYEKDERNNFCGRSLYFCGRNMEASELEINWKAHRIQSEDVEMEGSIKMVFQIDII